MGLFSSKDKTVSTAAAPQTPAQPQFNQPQSAPPPKEDKKKTKGFVKWTSAFLGAGTGG